MMHLTTKQLELLKVIGDANEDGSPTDLDQLLERLTYKPSKQSIQFSIRALVNHGLIKKGDSEKRRGRVRAIIELTEMGRSVTGKKKTSYLEPESEEIMDELTEIFEDLT